VFWDLFDRPTLATYCAAALALVAAPGPGQALVLARTLQRGLRAGLLTSLGLNTGTLLHTLAAALGLSALLLTSATAFTIVKIAGAAYLVFLGIRTLLASRRSDTAERTSVAAAEPSAVPSSRLLLHGAVTGVLNPKVAIFFLAFLPQFVRPERGAVLLQFLILGLILATLGVMGDSLVAVLAARAGSAGLAGRWRERVTGGVLVALGLRLAFLTRV
jgi:threonine/homoserine/homoserine lactone efflux protein